MLIDPELWRRAEDVFHAALDHTREDRGAFLNEACGDHGELRTLVETLLMHDECAGTFMEHPPIDGIGPETTPPGVLIGWQHGSYRFVSLLGAGGMGEVYRAHDEKLGRDVAIKTLPPEFARDPARVARFRREARTLAALNHPNIAAIYELEESEDVDYLVLELVQGESPRGPVPLAAAFDRLVILLYPKLRRLARQQLRRRLGTSVESAALANEAYLKLARAGGIACENRSHFLALCSQIMRRILVDHARRRGFMKRGGDAVHVALDEAQLAAGSRGIDLLALDEALEQLARIDSRKSRVVELRYFGGLEVGEIAEVLDVSAGTVKRDWRLARAWLLAALNGK